MSPPAPLPVITSKLLEGTGVRHAFFTRQGGVSEGLYASLNVGSGSNDDPGAVIENRRRAAAHFSLPADALATCHQVHSARAVRADVSWGDSRPEADAVVSAAPGVLCGALAADCAPILLADPEARVVAAAHAGWKGALTGIVAATVAEMTAAGARPERIIAAVGPCIAQASYEVGQEFFDRFVAEDTSHGRFFIPGASADKHMFDLPGFVLARLKAAGVGQAAAVGRDTCAEADLFFSNRRAFKQGEGDYGRLLSAITL